MGMPTNGRQFSVKGMNFFRIVDGKIVENWSSFDMLSLLQQLGVIPAME
jgi:predicted ester cyclase